MKKTASDVKDFIEQINDRKSILHIFKDGNPEILVSIMNTNDDRYFVFKQNIEITKQQLFEQLIGLDSTFEIKVELK